jgi:hypothetical protein
MRLVAESQTNPMEKPALSAQNDAKNSSSIEEYTPKQPHKIVITESASHSENCRHGEGLGGKAGWLAVVIGNR